MRWRSTRGTPLPRSLLPDVAVTATTFAVLLIAVTVVWEPLFRIDVAVVDALNDLVSGAPTVATALRLLTDLGGAQVAWVVIPLLVLWLSLRRAWWQAAYVAATGAGAAILDPGVKALVGRTRPVVDVAVATAPGESFPSGHALGAVVTYGLLLLVFLSAVPARHRRMVTIAAVSIVAFVGLTRVALGVHHPSDVVAGWSLGVLWLATTNVAFRPVTDEAHVGRPGGEDVRPAPRAGAVLPRGARTAGVLVVGAVLSWGALVAVGEWVTQPTGVALRFDAAVIDVLAAARTSVLSATVTVVGHLGGIVGIVSGLAVAVVVALALTRRWRPPFFLLLAVGGETAIFLATASIVQRGRPEVEVLIPNLPPTTSFPSGHVAAAVALYGAVTLLLRTWRGGWVAHTALGITIVVVVSVALSRLYVGVHYPTDVLASVAYVGVWLRICWLSLRPGPQRPREAAAPQSGSRRGKGTPPCDGS